MKTIGLIGGMSWESTVSYYQIINNQIKETLGGLHSAKCILYSVDFAQIEAYQAAGEWDESGQVLAEAAADLQKAGADFIVICTNTMHKVVNIIERQVSIPILHIAEVTAQKLLENQTDKVALLGTKYTMEQDFYKEKLVDKGIEVIIPDREQREEINRIIFEELCLGTILDESKSYLLNAVEELSQRGARGIILGCTEIGLLISQKDTKVPLFDTARIHAKTAAMYAVNDFV